MKTLKDKIEDIAIEHIFKPWNEDSLAAFEKELNDMIIKEKGPDHSIVIDAKEIDSKPNLVFRILKEEGKIIVSRENFKL